MMDIYQFLHDYWVVWMVIVFLGIIAWVYWPSRRRKQGFDEAAQIPLDDETGSGDNEQRRD